MRKSHRKSGSSSYTPRAPVPDKMYFKMGEVTKLVGVQAHVLRYWEKEIPAIRPSHAGANQRRYRRRDVELFREVRRLLYEEKFTLAGARKHLTGFSPIETASGPHTRQADFFAGATAFNTHATIAEHDMYSPDKLQEMQETITKTLSDLSTSIGEHDASAPDLLRELHDAITKTATPVRPMLPPSGPAPTEPDTLAAQRLSADGVAPENPANPDSDTGTAAVEATQADNLVQLDAVVARADADAEEELWDDAASLSEDADQTTWDEDMDAKRDADDANDATRPEAMSCADDSSEDMHDMEYVEYVDDPEDVEAETSAGEDEVIWAGADDAADEDDDLDEDDDDLDDEDEDEDDDDLDDDDADDADLEDVAFSRDAGMDENAWNEAAEAAALAAEEHIWSASGAHDNDRDAAEQAALGRSDAGAEDKSAATEPSTEADAEAAVGHQERPYVLYRADGEIAAPDLAYRPADDLPSDIAYASGDSGTDPDVAYASGDTGDAPDVSYEAARPDPFDVAHASGQADAAFNTFQAQDDASRTIELPCLSAQEVPMPDISYASGLYESPEIAADSLELEAVSDACAVPVAVLHARRGQGDGGEAGQAGVWGSPMGLGAGMYHAESLAAQLPAECYGADADAQTGGGGEGGELADAGLQAAATMEDAGTYAPSGLLWSHDFATLPNPALTPGGAFEFDAYAEHDAPGAAAAYTAAATVASETRSEPKSDASSTDDDYEDAAYVRDAVDDLPDSPYAAFLTSGRAFDIGADALDPEGFISEPFPKDEEAADAGGCFVASGTEAPLTREATRAVEASLEASRCQVRDADMSEGTPGPGRVGAAAPFVEGEEPTGGFYAYVESPVLPTDAADAVEPAPTLAPDMYYAPVEPSYDAPAADLVASEQVSEPKPLVIPRFDAPGAAGAAGPDWFSDNAPASGTSLPDPAGTSDAIIAEPSPPAAGLSTTPMWWESAREALPPTPMTPETPVMSPEAAAWFAPASTAKAAPATQSSATPAVAPEPGAAGPETLADDPGPMQEAADSAGSASGAHADAALLSPTWNDDAARPPVTDTPALPAETSGPFGVTHDPPIFEHPAAVPTAALATSAPEAAVTTPEPDVAPIETPSVAAAPAPIQSAAAMQTPAAAFEKPLQPAAQSPSALETAAALSRGTATDAAPVPAAELSAGAGAVPRVVLDAIRAGGAARTGAFSEALQSLVGGHAGAHPAAASPEPAHSVPELIHAAEVQLAEAEARAAKPVDGPPHAGSAAVGPPTDGALFDALAGASYGADFVNATADTKAASSEPSAAAPQAGATEPDASSDAAGKTSDLASPVAASGEAPESASFNAASGKAVASASFVAESNDTSEPSSPAAAPLEAPESASAFAASDAPAAPASADATAVVAVVEAAGEGESVVVSAEASPATEVEAEAPDAVDAPVHGLSFAHPPYYETPAEDSLTAQLMRQKLRNGLQELLRISSE